MIPVKRAGGVVLGRPGPGGGGLTGLALIAVMLCSPASSMAYMPESPEVRRMAAAAMAYLEESEGGRGGGLLGRQALVALAAYKYNRRFGADPRSLPAMTRAGLERVVREVGQGKGAGSRNYTLGIVLMLLSEVQPQAHRAAMQGYLEELLRRQKPHGGWGYMQGEHKDTGDLSQLQYAVLGLWSARGAGLTVPERSMADVVNYVIRVQDPGGGWPYQGRDPGGYNRVSQPSGEIKRARTAAGLGSLYVGADFLGLASETTARRSSKGELPPALVPVKKAQGSEKSTDGASGEVSRRFWQRAVVDGHRWFNRNSLRTGKHQYYLLYGMERLYSFKAKVEGDSEPDPEPAWYNEGVRILRERQDEDGSWGRRPGDIKCCPTSVATAFGVLFLVRSTQLTVNKDADREGILEGGRGLPSDLVGVRVRGSQIVSPKITGQVDDLISMLEDEEAEKIESMLDNPGTLSLRNLEENGGEHNTRLARILRTGQSYKARVVAARALGRQDDLDNVPVLIYALTDPDPRVVRAARDALRLTARKLNGFGLSRDPSPAELKAVIAQWKSWYKSIRPDAVFFEKLRQRVGRSGGG